MITPILFALAVLGFSIQFYIFWSENVRDRRRRRRDNI